MKHDTTIPFNQLSVLGRELQNIEVSIKEGHTSGDGPFSKRCQTLLEEVMPIKKALLTTSCTHALEMSALLLDIGPGDEVIVPSFTFVTTANAFALRGATIVFADIRCDTLNLDENRLEQLITSRTKAIIVVHYAGVACAMDRIMEISRQHSVPVVEDNAHGLFGKFRNQFLGTFGQLATQSFHETKNFSCGEGGALLINDPIYIEQAEIIREKGTDRSRFLRGSADKYTWVSLGSSYVLSDMLAAFLLGQLECRERIFAQRRQIWNRYFHGLKSWAELYGIELPYVPKHCEQAYHMFYLIMPDLDTRCKFIQHLSSRGILAVFHYVPLHNSPFSKLGNCRDQGCPVSINVSHRLVRLPFYTGLSEADQQRVIDEILEYKL